MRVEKTVEVARPRDEVLEALWRDDTLTELFPDAETEVVESRSDRKTTRTHYRALGREGVATFHFDRLPDGNLAFEKVCDGKVWRELYGELSVEERRGRTRIHLTMEGRTRPLVPELAIRGPLKEQLEAMARALEERFGGREQ